MIQASKYEIQDFYVKFTYKVLAFNYQGSNFAEIMDGHNFAEKELDFKYFDIVTDYSDHHYASTKDMKIKDTDCFSNPSSAVHKKIMQEWKVLEENLPESIYVRVYENKINLLRAVIIGASGTPYHDGLFFFDLAFPYDYPTSPPQVNFLSHGMRLNPNLYESGKVCLSLLNTWDGQAKERWIPGESTILQVLLSIQGLVLNEEPFFNEPYYWNQHKNPVYLNQSRAYTDNAYLLSCKLMRLLMEKPLKNFEVFIGNYFFQRSHIILAAFNAYRNGESTVGKYQLSSCDSTKASPNFKKSMDTLYPNLVNAFTKIGALVQKESNSSPKAESKSRKSKRKVAVPENGLRRSARLKLKKN